MYSLGLHIQGNVSQPWFKVTRGKHLSNNTCYRQNESFAVTPQLTTAPEQMCSNSWHLKCLRAAQYYIVNTQASLSVLSPKITIIITKLTLAKIY